VPRVWIIWLAVTLTLAIYVLAGIISSTAPIAPIKLQPGAQGNIRSFRLLPGPLILTIQFDPSEAAASGTVGCYQDGQFLRCKDPGAPIRIHASIEGKSVVYEAMPSGDGGLSRNLTSSISIERGVWPWPPQAGTNLEVPSGFSTIAFSIDSADSSYARNSAKILVHPPLGFISSQPNYTWLWYWWFWPLPALIQLVWAGAIFRRKKKLRATVH
jgi:hypothetical protein